MRKSVSSMTRIGVLMANLLCTCSLSDPLGPQVKFPDPECSHKKNPMYISQVSRNNRSDGVFLVQYCYVKAHNPCCLGRCLLGPSSLQQPPKMIFQKKSGGKRAAWRLPWMMLILSENDKETTTNIRSWLIATIHSKYPREEGAKTRKRNCTA